MTGNGEFTYTYSAEAQAEIKRIREKYAPTTKAEDKMKRLRRLDASATGKAQTAALVFGIIGALILGFGLSLCMTTIGEGIGFSKQLSMVFGILFGIVGGVLASLAYPTYHFVLGREKKKIAPEIMRLADELMRP